MKIVFFFCFLLVGCETITSSNQKPNSDTIPMPDVSMPKDTLTK